VAAPESKPKPAPLIDCRVTDDPEAFSVGDMVKHLKFGVGSVKHVDGNKVTVAFEAGERNIVANFLERVPADGQYADVPTKEDRTDVEGSSVSHRASHTLD
jgi:hypothetical protein